MNEFWNYLLYISGIIVAVISIITFLPQLIKVIKTKNTESLSFSSFSLFASANILFTIYAILYIFLVKINKAEIFQIMWGFSIICPSTTLFFISLIILFYKTKNHLKYNEPLFKYNYFKSKKYTIYFLTIIILLITTFLIIVSLLVKINIITNINLFITWTVMFLSGVLFTISFLPQSIKVTKTKDTVSISLITFVIYVINNFIWIIWAITSLIIIGDEFSNSVFIVTKIIQNIINLSILKIKIANRKKDKEIIKKLQLIN